MIDKALKKLVNSEDLQIREAIECMQQMMKGEASQVLMASFLTALKMKGETVDEIYAFAKVMRENALKVDGSSFKTLVDTCGTGGDGARTFNISTTAMFIAAGAGVKIAKHGNRSITSKCGAADVLESLGIKIELNEKEVSNCIENSGVGFMFAPAYHSAMKHVMPTRRELGFRTVFNILGPLSNPARAKRQLMGVFDKGLVFKLADVLRKLELEQAMVVHGKDGMDEISLTTNTYVAELTKGKIIEYEIDPRKYGFSLCDVEKLAGGDSKENAEIIRSILKGEKSAKSDIALLNAGGAIYVSGIARELEEGIDFARKSIESGKALEALDKFAECSNG